MTLISCLALVATIIANSIANILVKRAGTGENGLAMYLNVNFISGVFFYGVNLFFYTIALKHISLPVTYSLVIGGTLALISCYSFWGLHEPLSIKQLLGMVFILVGACLVVR